MKERKFLPAKGKGKNKAAARERSSLDAVSAAVDSSNMSETVRALLQRVRLRPKNLYAVDLTTDKSQVEKDEADKVKKKAPVILKLPDRLSVFMVRCIKKDKVREKFK